MTVLPGIEGSLFPGRFLATLSGAAPEALADAGSIEVRRRQFTGWWRRVETTCGPATGLRALFDVVAMPLAGLLQFRASDAAFEPGRVFARLRTPAGTELRLALLPWASRPSRLWRDLARGDDGATWWLLVAPPYCSVLDARGQALRRSVDFQFPQVLDGRSFPVFWAICRAGAHDKVQRSNGPTVQQSKGPKVQRSCIDELLERAAVFQDSVREDLQAGVVEALGAIAPVLRPRLTATAAETTEGGVDARFSEALTLIYRILFLLFAESRDLVPRHHPRYGPAYALTSLCREAIASRETSVGLWEGLAAVTRLARAGCETSDLIVRPFNGRLFARASAPSLEAGPRVRHPNRISRRGDAAMVRALAALGSRPGPGGREEITFADLDVEQLGAVYERVLDLDPATLVRPGPIAEIRARAARVRHSARRKESGTFYTPRSLAEFVVRRTLAPLVRGASTDDILALRVVDPAMGSGAFLVAACRFLARAYGRALVDEGRCAETDLDSDARADIRRLIATRCLAGADANPVAVQLARLSLWLTTLARDKPLNFLDHRLRTGDSLVGASPDDLWRTESRDRPRRQAGAPLFDAAGLHTALSSVVTSLRQLRDGRDDTVADVRAHERQWAHISGSQSPLAPWRAACDLWCARWFWEGPARSPSGAELRAALDAVLRRDATLAPSLVRDWLAAARAAAVRRGFFHWPLEFADVFYDDGGLPKERAGFDAVIGNPPWEMVGRNPLIAFLRQSGLYPSCDRGHLNLYQPFLERSISLARRGGRIGLVLPWGLAADDGAASLRRRLLEDGRIETLVGLDNAGGIFPIHRGLRFLVLVACPGGEPRDLQARFGVRTSAEIDALPGLAEAGDRVSFPVRLGAAAIRATGGAALRIPDARNPGDLEWLGRVSRRFPPLGIAAGWSARFGRELNATEDRSSFGTTGLPVIDGKHISPFRTSAGASSRRIPPGEAARLLPNLRFRRARLAYRDVSGVGNRQTLIAAIIPADVVTTHTLFCLRNDIAADQQLFLCGLFNSSVLNRLVRLLMGSHVTTGLVEHLPVPPWTGRPEQQRIADLAATLATGPDAVDSPALQRVRAQLDEQVESIYSRPGA